MGAMQRQILNAVDAGDGDVIVRDWQRRLFAHPEDLATRMKMVGHFEGIEMYDLAAEHLRLAIDRNADDAGLRLHLANVQRKLRLEADAIATLESATASPGMQRPELWSMLGILRDDDGDLPGAESAYRSALALAPGDDALHNNLGYNLTLQKRGDEAIGEFEAALRIQPRSEVARNNLAIALAASDRPDRSRKALLHWEALGGPAFAHSNLAAAFIEQGKYPEARQELAQALSLNPSMPEALRNLRVVAGLDGGPAEYRPQARPGAIERLAQRIKRWLVVEEEVSPRKVAGRASR